MGFTHLLDELTARSAIADPTVVGVDPLSELWRRAMPERGNEAFRLAIRCRATCARSS